MLEIGDNVTPRYPKGQGGYEDVKFSKILGGTTACMKRIYIATKGCGQLTSNDTYFSDSWFSSIKTTEEAMAAGVDYFGPAKTSHKVFWNTLEKLMEYWPGGSYLVMKSTPIFPCGIPLLAIG